MRGPLLCLAALLGGCFSLERPPRLEVLCDSSSDCPSGLVCARPDAEAEGCCVDPQVAASLKGGNPDGLVCRSWCADPRLRPGEGGACRPVFSGLAASDAATCGLLTSGSGLAGAVYCWGDAAGRVTDWYRDRRAGPLLSRMTARGAVLCGLELEGRALQCWSLLSGEPAGLLTDERRRGGFVDLAMATDHVCGLTADGGAVCLPLPPATDVPLPGPTPPKWKALAPGTGSDCGLALDGAVACWPALPAGLIATSGELLARSSTVGCVVTSGDLHCWAESEAGKTLAAAVQPEAGVPVVALAVGDELVCALAAADAARPPACWASAAVSTPADTTLSSLVVGKSHACALRRDGSAACWGANDAGQAPRVLPAAP